MRCIPLPNSSTQLTVNLRLTTWSCLSYAHCRKLRDRTSNPMHSSREWLSQEVNMVVYTGWVSSRPSFSHLYSQWMSIVASLWMLNQQFLSTKEHSINMCLQNQPSEVGKCFKFTDSSSITISSLFQAYAIDNDFNTDICFGKGSSHGHFAETLFSTIGSRVQLEPVNHGSNYGAVFEDNLP